MAIIALIFGTLFIPVTIPYRVIMLAGAALIWTVLEARSLQPVGLGRHPLRSTMVWAISIAVGVISSSIVVAPIINWLLGVHADLSGYGALKGNAQLALQLLGFALVSAAVGEEILFRGFLLRQLTEIFGSSNQAQWCSILVSSTLFGLAHSMQGLAGIITTGLVGAIFSWAWFRSGRNLWALIVAHALVDSFGIGMLYLGWSAI
ncbi:hypothetical protein NX02_01105 [Sphingomonas sanxanigenens DSM 19645 = NX02]|uniref:CAAX prenyl protease 2/Lysostaphin resistance protein A-like domain-containing protein n=1 Tax=Sphingomonas sanxanigenens DSM 19645 = NX02 TaxID=1123269 RepID=W0A6A6_9SPHN|nr:hypothetical protein NX02_01105 [Sphingomonas sanxanigenens DSM 19645 = NX02]